MGLFGFKRRKLVSMARKGIEKLLQTQVKEIMTDYVVTISEEKTVIDAATIMIGEDVSALVVEKDSKPLGILTERDFISKVPVSSKVFSLKVKDIMSCSNKKGEECVASVRPETTLREARNILKEKGIRKLVVTREDGLIAGIVTQTDLSKALYNCIEVLLKLERKHFFVHEVMSKKIVSMPRSSDFKDAKKLMEKENISALPITEAKEFVGIFTEYDVVMQFYDAGGKLDIKRLPEIMKTPIKTVPSDITIFDANMIMLFEKIRRLVVVKDREVVGFVSQTDLVHSCFDYCETMLQYLDENASIVKVEDLRPVKRKGAIISEYAGDHLRSYTVK